MRRGQAQAQHRALNSSAGRRGRGRAALPAPGRGRAPPPRPAPRGTERPSRSSPRPGGEALLLLHAGSCRRGTRGWVVLPPGDPAPLWGEALEVAASSRPAGRRARVIPPRWGVVRGWLAPFAWGGGVNIFN